PARAAARRVHNRDRTPSLGLARRGAAPDPPPHRLCARRRRRRPRLDARHGRLGARADGRGHRDRGALSAQEWVLLASAIVPVIAAAAVYYFGFRLAKRQDERDAEERDRLRERLRPPGGLAVAL